MYILYVIIKCVDIKIARAILRVGWCMSEPLPVCEPAPVCRSKISVDVAYLLGLMRQWPWLLAVYLYIYVFATENSWPAARLQCGRRIPPRSEPPRPQFFLVCDTCVNRTQLRRVKRTLGTLQKHVHWTAHLRHCTMVAFCTVYGVGCV